MDTIQLENIGLSEGESKVYFALVKLGEAKTGQLSKEANISSSKIYEVLDRLEKKGLVGHIMKGEVKYFNALNPNRLINYIDEKKNALQKSKDEVLNFIPQIQAMMNASKKSEASMYVGFKGVTNLFKDMLDELKKGDSYYILGASFGNIAGLKDFFHRHNTKRAAKGVFLNMLASYELKKLIGHTTKKHAKIKYLPKQFNTNMELVFYKNKTFIVIWSKNPVGFLIENEETVKAFRAYFDLLWIAKF